MVRSLEGRKVLHNKAVEILMALNLKGRKVLCGELNLYLMLCCML